MRSAAYWDASNLNLQDALNAEIWRDSPEVQKKIQSPAELEQPGSIGAQQAMLDGDAASQVLPWVPDLIGKRVGDGPSILVIGPHYSGFIRKYSRRRETLDLDEYLAAKSAGEFVTSFVDKVVKFDEIYYRGIEYLLHDLVNPQNAAVMDLCRASFVRRGKGGRFRLDEASEAVVHEGWQAYTRYVEDERPRAWTLRRIRESNARVIVALGSIAEHGLLRLIDWQDARVADFRSGHRLRLQHTGPNWTERSADGRWRMRYWYTKRSWWQTHIDGRKLFVLPVLQPFRAEREDPHYEKTRIVLSQLLEAAYGQKHAAGSGSYLKRYRPLRGSTGSSGFLLGEDLVTGRTVLLKTRDISEGVSVRIIGREVQMLSVLNRPEFLLCTDYGREAAREIAVYEHNPDARPLSEALRSPRDGERPLVGPEASFDAQRPFLRGLVDAINAMHSEGIVHGAITESAIWLWPVGGVWLSKLAHLDVAATNAVSREGSSAKMAADTQCLAKLVRKLLSQTAERDRDPRWHHILSVAARIEGGERLDVFHLLVAIAEPILQFDERLTGFRATIGGNAPAEKKGEAATELVRSALSTERVAELPRESLRYVASSDPKLLTDVIRTLLLGRKAQDRYGLIGDIVDILITSGDIDPVHESSCHVLLTGNPQRLDALVLDRIYDLGVRYAEGLCDDGIKQALVSFCSAHSKTGASDAAKWIDRLRSWNAAAADELESKRGNTSRAQPLPPECDAPDLSKVVPQAKHHLREVELNDWARSVCDRCKFVWGIQATVTRSGSTPSVGRPQTQRQGRGRREVYIPVVLSDKYTLSGRYYPTVNIFLSPDTSDEQMQAARSELLRHEDLFPCRH